MERNPDGLERGKKAQKILRILMLEDNPNDAELIRFELEEAGLAFIFEAVDTEEAYKKSLLEFCPDLILSDYDLPRYEGILALSEARKSCPDVPFILVTGAVSEDRAIEVLTSGAQDYVLKNHLSRLVPAVRRVLGEAAEHRARKKAEEELREAHRTLESKVEQRTAELQAEMAERQKREDSLRESEERFSKAFYASPAAILIQRVSDGIFVDANDSFLDLFEYQREEVVGRGAADLNLYADPDDRATLVGIYQEHGRIRNHEMTAKTKSGKLVQIVFSTEILTLGGVAHSISTLIDITERRRAEEAMRESEERYRLIYESSLDGILFTKPDGSIISANPAAQRILGRTEDEIINAGRDGILDTSDPRLGLALEERDHTGRFVGELSYKRKDGTIFPVEISTIVFTDKKGELFSSVIFRDITWRKEAERQLKEFARPKKENKDLQST